MTSAVHKNSLLTVKLTSFASQRSSVSPEVGCFFTPNVYAECNNYYGYDYDILLTLTQILVTEAEHGSVGSVNDGMYDVHQSGTAHVDLSNMKSFR